MSRFRNTFVTVCVMGLWLLATQHCGLEAAGLFAVHDAAAESTGCCTSSEGCASDGCATVEEGAYRSDNSATTLPAPSVTLSAYPIGCDVTPPRELCANLSLRDPFERPLDWVTTWQFVQRAARSPRAPSSG